MNHGFQITPGQRCWWRRLLPFRQRGIFTIPENVVRLRRGRPRVSAEQKKAKARARDQRYREKIRQKLNKLKQLEEAGLV